MPRDQRRIQRWYAENEEAKKERESKRLDEGSEKLDKENSMLVVSQLMGFLKKPEKNGGCLLPYHALYNTRRAFYYQKKKTQKYGTEERQREKREAFPLSPKGEREGGEIFKERIKRKGKRKREVQKRDSEREIQRERERRGEREREERENNKKRREGRHFRERNKRKRRREKKIQEEKKHTQERERRRKEKRKKREKRHNERGNFDFKNID